jgi:hypothetical protein
MFDIRKFEPEDSKIFCDWNKNAGVTWEDFCAGVEWVKQDPCDGSTGGREGQLTRELGCDRKRGLVKLTREYTHGLVTFYECTPAKKLRPLWNTYTGASISARDRILNNRMQKEMKAPSAPTEQPIALFGDSVPYVPAPEEVPIAASERSKDEELER